MTIGQLDCCSSSCRKAFAYSLQGLKFCPFDCSTRTRLRLAAPAGSEAETTIPRAIRHFNTECTSIPVRGAIDGGPEKCSQYGCPLRITIRIDFTQQPSFRGTILLQVTCQNKMSPFPTANSVLAMPCHSPSRSTRTSGLLPTFGGLSLSKAFAETQIATRMTRALIVISPSPSLGGKSLPLTAHPRLC